MFKIAMSLLEALFEPIWRQVTQTGNWLKKRWARARRRTPELPGTPRKNVSGAVDVRVAQQGQDLVQILSNAFKTAGFKNNTGVKPSWKHPKWLIRVN